ncbi:GatB/YqeY domain-containing protein [Amnimonas aquatica]|uniref:Glutamyl-tRNA amidotransferase n=1 Tax=Amnimonas aquatica TaxID=2094561 RepID=A0A2P6AU16_9GAMM|nr:GatB/YqeY domain-containing protein [Amnimonas aquatica]PQA48584.1 glutamyl-tRNA amidotransferase [Amnimonas aquatica]
MSAQPTLKARLTESMKDAMRSQDKDSLGVIRMALAAFKQIEVDERIELDDARSLAVLEKLVKQRRESATAFESAGRQELAAREQAEIVVLQRFLPVPLSEDELAALISAAIAEAGATSARDMGKVMNLLRPMVAGRADVGALSQLVKTRLAS